MQKQQWIQYSEQGLGWMVNKPPVGTVVVRHVNGVYAFAVWHSLRSRLMYTSYGYWGYVKPSEDIYILGLDVPS